MAKNTNDEPLSFTRRFFLRKAGQATAAAAASGAVIATIPSAEEDGPITPAEWLAEMRRIGWDAAAGDFRGSPLGVIEYCRDDSGNIDETKFIDTMTSRRRLSKRVNASGADFFKRTSRYLFDLGLREKVGPVAGGHVTCRNPLRFKRLT